jgi:hydroxymethylglutaryl-CoA lyase
MKQSTKVKIREVAPRDGFQSWPTTIPTADKLEVIHAVIAAGLKEVEAASFVNPKAIPQMRDAADVVAGSKSSQATICGLVPNLRGAQGALDAGVDEIMVFISATEAHNQANVRRSVDESLQDLGPIFTLAAKSRTPVLGAVAVAFGCPFEGDVRPDAVSRIVEAYTELGANTIVLGDTTGMATPPRVSALLDQLTQSFSGVDFCLHFHNNRGSAMVNLYAALEAGATTFDTALGGIGGCPNVPQAAGNLPTEDVVYLLHELGIETGIDLDALIQASKRLEAVLGQTLPGQVMKSGPRLTDPGCCTQ